MSLEQSLVCVCKTCGAHMVSDNKQKGRVACSYCLGTDLHYMDWYAYLAGMLGIPREVFAGQKGYVELEQPVEVDVVWEKNAAAMLHDHIYGPIQVWEQRKDVEVPDYSKQWARSVYRDNEPDQPTIVEVTKDDT